jgi:feruloyl esterase
MLRWMIACSVPGLCGAMPALAQKEAPPQARCTALATGAIAGLAGDAAVDSAVAHAAAAPLPAHCEVIGHIARRTGSDRQSYEIRYHLRLPFDWNRRFFFQGGGGSDGVLGDALGNLQGEQSEVALSRGFAVVSQDSGHDNNRNDRPDHGGPTSFGWDYTARRNYAFASLGRVTATAKALLATFYGGPPQYSYFVGCSKGGQEGMAMAEHFPDDFDGIMANAPGFSLPRAALAQLWDTKAFMRLAESDKRFDANGVPLLNATFSNADLGLVSGAVLKACDALDGARDGIVGAVGQCTTARVRPELARLVCNGAKTASCLSGGQIEAFTQVMGGPKNSQGHAIYSDWMWDAGIGGDWGSGSFTGWRAWKLGTAGAALNDGRNVLLGGTALPTMFQSPPVAVANTPAALITYAQGVNMDAAQAGIYRTTSDFPVSAWDLMAARSADRSAFQRHGGRMLVAQGVADPVFSINDTLDWWRALDKADHGHAADFARVFPVPGMNHCRGGPGTTSFDAFTALQNWVEKGQAPQSIRATAPKGTPWPGRTRPLCAWPATARYAGHGDLESAASFSCVAPNSKGPAS